MVKDTSNEIKFVKNAIGNWVSDHTEIEVMSADTLEVATTEIDAYGDTVYCFIQKIDDTYKIGDDGHILFKLDRSLLILPKLALLVKKIKIVELLVPLDFVKLSCLHFSQNLILLFQALFDFRIAFRVKILCAN